MRYEKIAGQEGVFHPTYSNLVDDRVIAISSVGEHLWVGGEHHLTRKEVQKLIVFMQTWVDTGHLKSKFKKGVPHIVVNSGNGKDGCYDFSVEADQPVRIMVDGEVVEPTYDYKSVWCAFNPED